ncbi:transposase family protein [Promicromonospora sp. NPDC050880]|uniref:transposase family protein n=1 Tax=Promicromonospora sp. NPDC050880 TaxID=3364406 RepID=UPI0037ABCC68
MITYRASLDVPATTLEMVTRWLAAHRRRPGARPVQRAATARMQALLVLRWFKDATRLRILALDAGISIATAYRYLHEAIDVIADQAPTLAQALERGRAQDWAFVALDGTLIATTKVAARGAGAADLWWSGKHAQHGGNLQVLAGPGGYPEWVSPVEPGTVNDIVAARAHVLPFLYPAAAGGLPTLTDKGYEGAGIGIIVPFNGANLNADAVSRNATINALRAPAERANALLKATWPALRRITLDPWRITEIAAAALVLLHLQRPVSE